MLVVVYVVNEEVSILELLYYIIGIGCYDWGIISCVSVVKFRSSLGKCY